MILNIVNAPIGSTAFNDCLRLLNSGDGLILIEDGVLAAVDSPRNHHWQSACPPGVNLYVLQEDLLARGLEAKHSSRFEVVNYNDFVDLAVRFPLSQSWF